MAILRFVEPRFGRLRLREWRRRALRVLASLVAILLVCAVGLALLDNSTDTAGDKLLTGLWNAVNLLSTLGDFSAFDRRQKVFMMLAMLAVMIVGAYAVGQLTGILSSPEVMAFRENRQMQRELGKLSEHMVVLGFVGLGRMLAEQLRTAGCEVVVIDREESAASLAAEAGFLVVKGDAGVEDAVLANAKVENAHTLFVTTDDPNRNLALTLRAHTLNAKLRIVVIAQNARWGDMLRRAGAAEVVIAEQIMATAMLGRIDAAPDAASPDR